MGVYSFAELVFTGGAFMAWGLALWWALRQPKWWYHAWILGLVTLFWWIGENIAIRLGKYQYPNLPFRPHLPFAGTPGYPGKLEHALRALLPAGERLPSEVLPACAAASWDIPLPVIAIEAALLFGIFRIAVKLFKSEPGSRVRAALATAGLSGLLMVNVTAILDPVVSTTMWCEKVLPDPGYHFLNVRLWEWYTTPSHPGFWYGVPLVNYAAWFLGAAVFAFVARLDDERQSGIIKRYRLILAYLAATLVITAVILLLLIGVKVGVDRVFAYGREAMPLVQGLIGQQQWEFGVMASLLALAGIVAWQGRRHHSVRFEAVCFVPKFMVLAFCLGLLVREPHLGIFAIWLLSFVITIAVRVWPRLAGRGHADRRLAPPVAPPSTGVPGTSA